METVEPIRNRIAAVRKDEKLTQAEFAARLGVTRSVIKNVEFGSSNPTSLLILAICREFSVNKEWLETGAGEMYVKISNTQEKLASMVGSILRPDTDERKKEMVLALITAIYELPDELLPEVHKFAKAVADASAEKEKDGG